MDEKIIISEENVQKFKLMTYREIGIKKLQESLAEQLAELEEERSNFWEEMYDEYNLDKETHYRLNHMTREISRRK